MLLIFISVLLSCGARAQQTHQSGNIYPVGDSIHTRFLVPSGYHRMETASGSFGNYLQHFPLKKSGTAVYLHNGQLKSNQQVHVAVLDLTTGKKDLQQCADAVMRLRSEYLFAQKRPDEIGFHFTNGFFASFSKWRKGYGISVQGNVCSWVENSSNNSSYESFLRYMDKVFMYAGTASLEKELKPVIWNEIQPGDVIIRGGSPGHAVLVMDVCIHEQTGERLFLLAQSYMPAQDMHVLMNPSDKKLSPWYSNRFSGPLITPEWTFESNQLRRFIP